MTSNKPFIFQIVGYSKSGKTTLITKWIKILQEGKWKVATIKHHGHSRPLTILDQGKDSRAHREAGALGSLVVSNHEFQWQMSNEVSFSLKDFLSLYEHFALHVIIIEGYKQEKFPKLLLIRNPEDDDLIEELINVEAIICWDHFQKDQLKQKLEIPIFHLSEEDKYIDWLVRRVQQ